MRVKLVRDDCAAVRETSYREDQNVFPANSLAGKHMALLLKLHEEADEISRDATSPEEYADLLETVFELAKINGVSQASIESARLIKKAERGGFAKGIIWTCDTPKPTTGILPHPCSVEGKKREAKISDGRLFPRK